MCIVDGNVRKCYFCISRQRNNQVSNLVQVVAQNSGNVGSRIIAEFCPKRKQAMIELTKKEHYFESGTTGIKV